MVPSFRSRWDVVPLGTIAGFSNGLNYTKANFGKGLKVVNVKDFKNHSLVQMGGLDEINLHGKIREKDLLQLGDILFVRSNGNRDLIGRSVYVSTIDEQIAHSGFTIKTRFTSESALPRFYSYVFRSPLIRRTLSDYGGGTNISNLNQQILTDLLVPLPPLSTQKKIVFVLSAYDDLIENNERRIKILEEMAQSIYREWFVNYRFPGHEGVRMVDSELGEIPEGWNSLPLRNVCTKITDGSHTSPASVDEGYPMASVKDMSDWGLDDSACRRISKQDYDKLVINDCKPLLNDILIAKDGSYLKHAFVVDDERNLVVLSSIAILRPNLGAIVPQLLCQTLRQPHTKARLAGYVSGVAIPRIILKDFATFPVVVPPMEIQEQFNDISSDLVRMIQKSINSISNLRQTRDMLLPKLISGELDVEELNIAVS